MSSDKNKQVADPLLPLGPGQNSFKVPNNYFDHLPADIMNTIHSSAKQQAGFTLRPSLSFIALGILTCLVFMLIYFSQKETPLPVQFALTDTELQHVVDNPPLYNIDDNSITEEYLLICCEEPAALDEDASEEEIQTYLEENIHTNNILTEL